eukprot:scaffold18423_cov67-Attheya_sp.AAC.1
MKTLIARFNWNAVDKADNPYLTWINKNESKEPQLTFGQFHKEVISYASWLKVTKCVEKSDRLILCYLPGVEFIKAFMACLYIGAVPVPVYPINPFQNSERRQLDIFNHILKTCEPKYILVDKSKGTTCHIMNTLSLLRNKHASPDWLSLRHYKGEPVIGEQVCEEDTAYIQFTSGTTGLPKGAVISHENLIQEFKQSRDILGGDVVDHTVGLAWVPPYHDLGLIGCLCSALANGSHLVMMSPLTFIRNPSIWFSTVSSHKITHTAAPNFAYSLCLDKIRDAQMTEWDLSSLEVIISAGEPVDQNMMSVLLRKLQDNSKLRHDVFKPWYGLAETLTVSGGGHQVLTLDRFALSEGRIHLHEHGVVVPACGRLFEETPIAIVNVNGKEMGEDAVGQVWVSGPSLPSCYFNDSKSTNRDLNLKLTSRPGRWFRTGDEGFLHKGELFLLGRSVDMITIDKRTFYPHHIEFLVNAIGASLFRKGSTTAYFDDESKKVVVAVELQRNRQQGIPQKYKVSSIERQICIAVSNAFWLDIKLHFMEPKSALKTSSGKLQRKQTSLALKRG